MRKIIVITIILAVLVFFVTLILLLSSGGGINNFGQTVRDAVNSDEFRTEITDRLHSPYPLSTDDPESERINATRQELYELNEKERLGEISFTKEVSELDSGGWVPYWAGNKSVDSIKKNSQQLKSASLFLYYVNEDGSLKTNNFANLQMTKSAAKSAQVELYATIALFDHVVLSGILNDETKYERHIQEIEKLAVNPDFAGIDLDYESTYFDDREMFFDLLKKVREITARNNKKLSVTVLAQWGEREYATLPQTRKVQDWTRISFYADEVRIMAYDYTFSNSQRPGPIAPYDWQRQVLEYAIQLVPREKIVLGQHTYSYEWWSNIPNASSTANQTGERQRSLIFKGYLEQESFLSGADPSPTQKARSYGYNTVLSILDQTKSRPDSSSYEHQYEQIYEYTWFNRNTNENEERTLVYISPEGVRKRCELAASYGIKGMYYWSLGDEGDLLVSN